MAVKTIYFQGKFIEAPGEHPGTPPSEPATTPAPVSAFWKPAQTPIERDIAALKTKVGL